MSTFAPADVVRADFDRLARCDMDAWSHNSHYHGFLLRQLPVPCEAALDLVKRAGPRDRLLDALALPANAALSLLKNGRLAESPEVRAARADHVRHDAYLTLVQIHQACAGILPDARVRRHLLWRYSLVWRKPAI